MWKKFKATQVGAILTSFAVVYILVFGTADIVVNEIFFRNKPEPGVIVGAVLVEILILWIIAGLRQFKNKSQDLTKDL